MILVLLNGLILIQFAYVLCECVCMLPEQALVGEYPRDFLGIALPEQPNKYYLIIRPLRIVLEADSTITTIMEKLQSYKQRVSLTFEVLSFSHSVIM